MPVPPPPVFWMLMGGGPKVMAAKAIAIECLPAVTSASLGAIVARVIWNRLPKWIREDVSFRNSTFYGEMNANGAQRTTDIERLSSVLEKIQAWIQDCVKRLKDPIPHLYASFFIYWQLMSIHRKITVDSSLINVMSFEKRTKKQNSILEEESKINFENLRDMLHLATAAYYIHDADELRNMLDVLNYDVKTCVLPSRPGSVGYYVAFQRQNDSQSESTCFHSLSRTMVIGVRGTSTLEEVLTDACGRSVSFRSPESFGDEPGEGISNSIRVEVRAQDDDVVYIPSEMEDNREETNDIEIVSGHERIWVEQDADDDVDELTCIDKKATRINGSRIFLKKSSSLDSQIRCHEGILASAKRLFYQVRRIVEEHIVHSDCCQLIITGHSLGASAGCLLAMMLRSRYPELVMFNRIQVYAFGPPPVLDYDSAIGASTYVTSVVNQSDIIPRCSLANLEIFLEVLRQVSLDILVSKDIAPTSIQSTSAFLQQLSNDKEGPLWSREELSKAIQTALSMVEVRNPNHLYAPGKLLYMSYDGLQSEHLDDEIKRYSCQVTDGAAASLRIVTMNGYQMLGDHTTASYFDAIESLIQKQDSN